MRIAIVTHFPADPAAPRGGVEAVSVVLARALASRAEVHVVTLGDVTHTTVEEHGGFKVHRLPTSSGSMLGSVTGRSRTAIQRYLKQLKPDVVHAHDTYGIATRGLGLPRVFTIHGFIYADTALQKKRAAWLRAKVWERVEKRAWAEQPHIIAISPYVRERLNGIARGTMHDIDNPIAPEFFAVQRNEAPGTIFCAAFIGPRKNTLGLVQAFAKLSAQYPEAQLRIAGSIENPAYAEDVKRVIADHGLQERVHLLGKLSVAQVRDELARAGIFALVSLEENSPLGVEEAMAAGVPVVTSNRCGMPYLVRHGESGYLVDPLEVHDIAKRLSQLLGDGALRARLGACGKQIAEARFHPDVVAARTLEVYRKAAATRAKGATA